MKEIYKNGSFEITAEPGFKGEMDEVIKVSCNAKKIELKEVLYILKALFDNEDKIAQHLGGSYWMKQMVVRLLEGEIPEEIDEEYNRRGKYPGDAKLFNPLKWIRVFCESCFKQAYCPHCKHYIWRKKNGNT